jgi:amino acid adenylation domain-containing protein
MLLQEFLENSAGRLPGKTALVSGEVRLTFSEIDAAADRLACALRDRGMRHGDRVAVLADNSPETVIAVWAALKAGGTFLVINPTTKPAKVKFILNNCRASALVTHTSKWRTVSPALAGVESLHTVIAAGRMRDGMRDGLPGRISLLGWDEALSGAEGGRPPVEAIDMDLAALIYTSGTTGNPKGVMLSHLNMISASTSITTYLENTEDDIILNVLPMSFDYGLYQVLMAAQIGGTVILEKSFTYPYRTLEILRDEKATGFPIVPTMSAILLQMKELKKEEFPDLRYITNTAAALPVSHIEGLGRIFRGARIYSMYGLTECKRVSYLPPSELERRPTSVGRGMPNEQVYLVDEDDNVITEPGVVGELVVRGSNVMQGYWENPEETAKMLRPGLFPWERSLYSGDLFRMDDEGWLYFVSRRDDIIKSRGEKVSPKEVESALYALEGVVEAAVIGVPDDILGESIKAFVSVADGSGLTENDILAHCKANLEDFMVPQAVEIRASLPKTTSGKITKKELA